MIPDPTDIEATERFRIDAVAADGSLISVAVSFGIDTHGAEHFSVSVAGETFTADAEDIFDAFCQVRQRDLEPRGLLLCCYGASRNCYPSPMSRSMGGGWHLYRCKMGKPALSSDLVSLLNTGPDVQPATVAEQEAFYQEWLASLSPRKE